MELDNLTKNGGSNRMKEAEAGTGVEIGFQKSSRDPPLQPAPIEV